MGNTRSWQYAVRWWADSGGEGVVVGRTRAWTSAPAGLEHTFWQFNAPKRGHKVDHSIYVLVVLLTTRIIPLPIALFGNSQPRPALGGHIPLLTELHCDNVPE